MTTLTKAKPIDTRSWGSYVFELFDTIMAVSDEWSAFVIDRNVFLSVGYLKAMEEAPPKDMTFYYVVAREQGEVVGVVYFQVSHFNAKASLNYSRNGNGNSATSKLRHAIRDLVANRLDFYTVIIGNSTVTGPHGFLMSDEVSEEDTLGIVDSTAEWVAEHSIARGFDVQLTFVKDFYRKTFKRIGKCARFPQYNEFAAQPGMHLVVQDVWTSFDDYMNALTSKYRVRVRRARKKAKGISLRELSLEEITKMEEEIYGYYRSIADKAVFNLFILNEKYFSTLKKNMGPDFRLFGYFEGSKLVAFHSEIVNGQCIEAHFLGYEDSYNREHQLYLNMLYNIIENAIDEGCREVFFARTALEIKSSVGAVAREMYFYLQHSNGLHNKFLPRLYNLLDPGEEWTPRSPFKE